MTADVDTVAQPTHRATEQPAIEGRGLSKVYGLGDRQAARALAADDPAAAVAAAGGYLGAADVSFSIGTGEMFVVMGLSGSGKSTVLRMINRLNEPTAGELLIDGEDITKVSDSRLREIRNNKIGMVFQHFSLFPHRTVRDNAAYGLKVRGVGKAERRERADAALERVGLGDRGDKLPHELSGGMRQRVGLARALAVDPPVLLMDEPFSALDPLIRRDMQDLLLELQAEDRRTTVFVTHDLNEAMRIGDQVMVMRQGRVVQCAPGAEIVAHPADEYVSEFVADVDRARVLTAYDLQRPAKLVFDGRRAPRRGPPPPRRQRGPGRVRPGPGRAAARRGDRRGAPGRRQPRRRRPLGVGVAGLPHRGAHRAHRRLHAPGRPPGRAGDRGRRTGQAQRRRAAGDDPVLALDRSCPGARARRAPAGGGRTCLTCASVNAARASSTS